MISSISNTEHYTWGENCDGWHLLKSGTLSVIQEKMPPGTSETLHFHSRAQQLFYILKGTATFTLDLKNFEVKTNESFHIKPGTVHSLKNNEPEDLHFLVISEPPSHGDRQNI